MAALWPQAAGGIPFSMPASSSPRGDVITDLHEDLAAEQKARTTYDNLLRLVKDPEVADPFTFSEGERNCSSEIWRMFKNHTGTSGCEELLYYES